MITLSLRSIIIISFLNYLPGQMNMSYAQIAIEGEASHYEYNTSIKVPLLQFNPAFAIVAQLTEIEGVPQEVNYISGRVHYKYQSQAIGLGCTSNDCLRTSRVVSGKVFT